MRVGKTAIQIISASWCLVGGCDEGCGGRLGRWTWRSGSWVSRWCVGHGQVLGRWSGWSWPARAGTSATAVATSSSTRSLLMAMAAAEPSPAAVMTWARGLTAFPAAQTPGTLVRPVASATTQPLSSSGAAEAGQQVVVRARSRGRTNTAARGTTCAGRRARRRSAGRRRRRAGRPGPRRRRWRGRRAARARRRSAGRRVVKNTTSSDHCRTSWACGDGLGGPAEDAEGLVADLVAVAVRAVQQVAAPALAHPGDVGELVAQPGGDQDAAGAQRPAVGEGDLEAGARRRRCAAAMPVTRAGDELAAVAGDLVAAGGQQLGGREAVASRGSPACARPGRCAAAPASTTATRRRARVRTRAADRPAAPPPMTTTSYSFMSEESPARTSGDNGCCRFRERRGAMGP